MILLRHGQSEFNVRFSVTRVDPGIEDPSLTALGHAQAEAAAEALEGRGLTRLLVSPYTRTLQTAAPLARRLGLAVSVLADIRERFAFACDVGAHPERLAEAWPGHDFSALPPRWWPEAREPADLVVERAARFRAVMAADPDQARTVVVSHWGFLMALTGTSVTNGEWLELDPSTPAPAEISWVV